jgi:hypothetical protein
MAECNTVVIDLDSVTTDDDDSSSSSIDSFHDSFVTAFDHHGGGAFVRNKVTIILDTDDETTTSSRRTTAVTFDGIDTDSSCCSLSLMIHGIVRGPCVLQNSDAMWLQGTHPRAVFSFLPPSSIDRVRGIGEANFFESSFPPL